MSVRHKHHPDSASSDASDFISKTDSHFISGLVYMYIWVVNLLFNQLQTEVSALYSSTLHNVTGAFSSLITTLLFLFFFLLFPPHSFRLTPLTLTLTPHFLLEILDGVVSSSVLSDHLPDLVEQLGDLIWILHLVIEDVVAVVTLVHELLKVWASIQQVLHGFFKLVSTGEQSHAESVHIWTEDVSHSVHHLLVLLSESVQSGDQQEDVGTRSR